MLSHKLAKPVGALFSGFLLAAGIFTVSTASAAPNDYRFELVGTPTLSGGEDVVQVRLIHVPDNKPVTNAVIFEATADMSPGGMGSMTTPVTAVPGDKAGVYSFDVAPSFAGTWALKLAAKIQGEAETVHGTVDIDLVK